MLFPWSVRGTSIRTRNLYGVCIQPYGAALVVVALVHLLPHTLPALPLIVLAVAFSYCIGLFAQALSADGREALRALVKLALGGSLKAVFAARKKLTLGAT